MHSHQQGNSIPFTFSSEFIFLFFLKIPILTVREWYLIVVYICIFLIASDVKKLSTYLLSIPVFIFWKMFKISAHFKIGLFWSFFGIGLWVPDIFWILTVPDTWFANILSHSVACLCVFLIVSFAVQKFFSLMHSYFLIYAFAAGALGVKSRKSLPKPMPRGLPSTISFRSFMLIDFV